MIADDRFHELAAEVADLRETVSALAAQIAQLLAMERTETGETVVNVPAPVVNVAPPSVTVLPQVSVSQPAVNVTLPPPPDCVISHEWGMDKGHYVPVRSFVTRT